MSDFGVSLDTDPEDVLQNPGATALGDPPFTISGALADYANRPQPPGSSLGVLMDDQQMRDAGVHPDQSGAAQVIDATGTAAGKPTHSHDGVLWGQLGTGALKATGGTLSAGTGVGLCSSGLGCVAGAPMAAIGTSDAVQGGTMMWDALHGKPSQGYNPLRDAAETMNSKWGGTAYDLASLAATAGSLPAKVPLVVDPALTGINTTRSLFGVTVPRIDNSTSILGNVLDSNVTKAILAGSVGKKAYDVYSNR
jgi:hypothetical protein